MTALSDPWNGPVSETTENVSATPAGAVPLSSSVAGTSLLVCAALSVATTVVGEAEVAPPRVGLMVTIASPVAPAGSVTRNVNESATFAADGV